MPRDDLETLARILEDVEQRLEDGTIAIRYLENVVNHPDEPKYRKINKANRRFSSEVWLQPGIRTAFLAIGFREDREEDGTAVLLLDPLTDHGRRCAEFTLERLKNIQARRRGGGGVAGAAAVAPAASHPDAGTESRPREASRSGTMTCEACGKSPLLEDTHSNRCAKGSSSVETASTGNLTSTRRIISSCCTPGRSGWRNSLRGLGGIAARCHPPLDRAAEAGRAEVLGGDSSRTKRGGAETGESEGHTHRAIERHSGGARGQQTGGQ